ncbi:hypothetical protein FF1_040900 [Malus domestica]
MKAQPYPLHLLTIPVSFGDFSDCLFRCNLHENSNNEAGFRWQTRQSELDRLFSKYGRVERVDMKSGFAFVYFEDEQDAEDAICGMTGAGYLGNGLRVNVVAIMMGLNHWQTRGRLKFDTQEEATEALQATHLRVVSVAYALRDNSERGDVERGDRYCDSPPRRGSYGRHGDSPYWRSPSPGCRRRPNPDYGCPRSPVYDRYNGPVYDRRRSPERGRNVSPEYGRYRSRSPIQR